MQIRHFEGRYFFIVKRRIINQKKWNKQIKNLLKKGRRKKETIEPTEYCVIYELRNF